MVEDERGEFPEQYSRASRDALAAVTERLVTALQAYVAEAATMRGGSSEMPALFIRNAGLEQVVQEWTDAVCDHTGTFPVVLAGPDEDDDDLLDEDDEAEIVGAMSVVSRWDLAVTDMPALVVAGRDAHRRNRPEETDADAAVAITHPADALYAVLHDAGELFHDLPGIEPLQASRWYVTLAEPPEPMNELPTVEDLLPPEGSVVRSERW